MTIHIHICAVWCICGVLCMINYLPASWYEDQHIYRFAWLDDFEKVSFSNFDICAPLNESFNSVACLQSYQIFSIYNMILLIQVPIRHLSYPPKSTYSDRTSTFDWLEFEFFFKHLIDTNFAGALSFELYYSESSTMNCCYAHVRQMTCVSE